MAGKVNYGEFEQFVDIPAGQRPSPAAFVPAVPEGVTGIQQRTTPPPSYWTDPIPNAMGVLGGAFGGPLLGVPAAGAMQGLGEFIRQRINSANGYPVPNDPRGAVLNQAAWGAGSELLGQAGAGVVSALGRGSMRGAYRDPMAAETATEIGGTVGRSGGKGGSAIPKAKAGMDRAAAELDALLSSAEASGVKADPREFEKILMDHLRKAQLNKAAGPEAAAFWNQRLAAWREQWNLHPTNPNATVVQVRDPATGRIVKTLQKQDIGIRDLNDLRRMNQEEAQRLANARKQTGGDRHVTLDEQYANAITQWSRQRSRQLVPGVNGKGLEWANAEYSRFKRLKDVAEGIENPKPGRGTHSVPERTVMGTTIPRMSPAYASRLGVAMTSPLATHGVRVPAHMLGYAMRGPASFYDTQRNQTTTLPVRPEDERK